MNARHVSLPPAVSVVVPTCGRPVLLERCLDALSAQVFDPTTYEIVIVDDDPDGSAKPVVDACRARTSDAPAIRYLTAPHTRGPAAARNVGWRAARGAVIAFTDDDTIADPMWLRHGSAALLAEPSAAAAAGRIDVPLRACPTDYERDAGGLAHAEFATANCFVRRGALERVGGFDERFTRAWREDADLMFALREQVGPAAICAAAWAAITGGFCWRRLRGTPLTPSHVAEMIVTSIAIPPVSLYWRLRGALHFRVFFL